MNSKKQRNAEICKLYLDGVQVSKLSEQYGITKAAIYSIIERNSDSYKYLSLSMEERLAIIDKMTGAEILSIIPTSAKKKIISATIPDSLIAKYI